MGLIRKGIILTVVFFALPTPPDDGQSADASASSYNDASYFVAATGAVSDLASFCQRQPTACEIGGYVLHKAEMKAKYSAGLIYDWAISDKSPPPLEQDPVKPLRAPLSTKEKSASTDPLDIDFIMPLRLASNKKAKVSPSASTLELPDMVPAWNGPQQA